MKIVYKVISVDTVLDGLGDAARDWVGDAALETTLGLAGGVAPFAAAITAAPVDNGFPPFKSVNVLQHIQQYKLPLKQQIHPQNPTTHGTSE